MVGVIEARAFELNATCVEDALGAAAALGAYDVWVLCHTMLDLKDFAA